MDRFAPARCATRPGAWQRPRPDGENFGGEVFGEIGILEETRRTADVRARSDVEVLALDWRDFKDLLDASDPTARDFMRIVEQRRAALPA